MRKVFALMSNTTSMNTGKKTGINNRYEGISKYLRDYAIENFENDAHALGVYVSST